MAVYSQAGSVVQGGEWCKCFSGVDLSRQSVSDWFACKIRAVRSIWVRQSWARSDYKGHLQKQANIVLSYQQAFKKQTKLRPFSRSVAISNKLKATRAYFYECPYPLSPSFLTKANPMFVTKATKSEFNSLITKAFKIADKSKKYIFDVARNIYKDRPFLLTEEPQKLITEFLTDKISSLADLENPLAAATLMINKFFEALAVPIAGKLKDDLEAICQRILGPTPESEQVPNVWHENLKKYDCVCGTATSGAMDEICFKCGRLCHAECFWERDTDTHFECPLCFLLSCVPLKPTKQILFLGYLRRTEKKKMLHYIKFFTELTEEDPHENLEIRCCRLSNKYRFELTFPENCNIYFSSRKLADFRPLPTNSPLKRRADEQIGINKFWLSKLNVLTVEEGHNIYNGGRVEQQEDHMLVIVRTAPLTQLKLERLYLEKRLGAQASRAALDKYLNVKNSELEVEGVTVSMKCQYFQSCIVYPARGLQCSTHYQPFDMLNFIKASLNANIAVQRWKCPICRKRAYDLFIDEYLLSLVFQRSNIADITFSVNKPPVIRDVDHSEEDPEDWSEKKDEKDQNEVKDSNIVDLGSQELQNPQQQNLGQSQDAIQIVDSDEDEQGRPKRNREEQDSEGEEEGPVRSHQEGRKVSESQRRVFREQQKAESKESRLQQIRKKIKTQITEIFSRKELSPQLPQIPAEPEANTTPTPQSNQTPASKPPTPSPNSPNVYVIQDDNPPSRDQSSDLKRQQRQILLQANKMLIKNASSTISLEDQVLFNSICKRLLNFKISP